MIDLTKLPNVIQRDSDEAVLIGAAIVCALADAGVTIDLATVAGYVRTFADNQYKILVDGNLVLAPPQSDRARKVYMLSSLLQALG